MTSTSGRPRRASGGARWQAPGGWAVEAVCINGREGLRVTQHGYYAGTVHSVAELARLLPLEALTEVVTLGLWWPMTLLVYDWAGLAATVTTEALLTVAPSTLWLTRRS